MQSLLPSSLGSGFALGAEPVQKESVRRLVAVGNLMGFQTPYLFPEKTGKNYEAPRLLQPFEKVRDQLTVYRGLDHDVKGGHFAVHSFLSGVLQMDAKGMPDGNISLDQLAAESIGGATRFPTLTVGSEGGIHGGCMMSWTRSGTRVPPVTGPGALFKKLFVKESAADLEKAKDRISLQGSILDAMNGDAKSLARRIDKEDREKLEEYMTSVRDVEKQIQLSEQWVEVPKPKAPFDQPRDRNMVEDLPLLYDLIALALQTDSTRIATLEIGGDFLPAHLGIKSGYHSLSHHGKKQDAIDSLLVIEEYQLKHFARFIEKMAGMNDGEGTLLDHTSVVFGSGMGNGNVHSNYDLPVLLAGGGFRHGEYKNYTAENGERKKLCNLYVSLLQNFGIERDSFGNSDGTLI
ncbi:MAG: DUF1552 domain-containing protein [Verrucomicrobiales bacterium]|nr:DUF1552 domain-containing protein [Verrucomicrobiales bacterium]